jgi:hypothetical protein
MSRMIRITWAGAGLLTLAACGPTIRSDRDENVPVPQGATWAWAAADTGGRETRGPAPAGAIVEQRFRRAIEGVMLAKGYHQVGDSSEADFALSADFGGGRAEPPAVRHAGAAVSLGFVGRYHPWGFGRFGFYRPWGFSPWGFYQPWGWGYYGVPMWGGFVGPGYPSGYRSYSDRALIVQLRHRPTGFVAWSGRLGSDAFYGHRLTQERVQRLVEKLFDSLH